ncbi:hypothetical protein AgCh_027202 [Apium graveolens]
MVDLRFPYPGCRFDSNKEVFTCLTMPPNESKHAREISSEAGHAHITDFNDSIVECFRGGGVVEASWTLMLSTETDVLVHSILSYLNCGDILLMSDEANCFSYNSVQKEAKKFPATICWDEIFKLYKELSFNYRI